MEFEDVSEKVLWEARRVAAAFRVILHKGDDQERFESWAFFQGSFEDATLEWAVERSSAQLIFVSLGRCEDDDYEGCGVEFNEGVTCEWVPHPQHNLSLACGLYRLGIDPEKLNHHLQFHLSAHEKMELRLSLPREFWPKTWLDQDGHG